MAPFLSRQEQLETAEIAARMAKPLTTKQEDRARQAQIAALEYEIEGAESSYRTACRKLGKANAMKAADTMGLGRGYWQGQAMKEINKARRILLARKAELHFLVGIEVVQFQIAA